MGFWGFGQILVGSLGELNLFNHLYIKINNIAIEYSILMISFDKFLFRVYIQCDSSPYPSQQRDVKRFQSNAFCLVRCG